MSKIAHYLQEHLLGEVSANPEVRHLLSTDSSALELMPAFVVYPRDEQDVRKTLRFAWQLAERGRALPITARGAGNDTSGAAIGSGAVILLPKHMHHILSLDPKKRTVIAEPGISYDKLQEVLATHELFIPAYPDTPAATIGGGISNNIVGEKSFKYGDTAKYVKSLRVVLANGEVIETGPLSKKDLSFKMGLSTFEGQIYRSLDALLEDEHESIQKFAFASESKHNAMGYKLANIKHKNGFDLTPLFIGAQGTLGIITEASLNLEKNNPTTYSAMVSLPKVKDLDHFLPEITKLQPSICDFVTKDVFDEVSRVNPNQLKDVFITPSSEIHLFVEFDDPKDSTRRNKMKSLGKIVERLSGDFIGSDKHEDKLRINKVKTSIHSLIIPPQNSTTAVPVAEDIAVTPAKLAELISKAQEIFKQNHLPAILWGHATSGIVRVHPILDLSEVGDRQKFFKLSESLYNLAVSMSGSVSASAGEGRIRAPYTRQLYGEDYFNLTLKVKAIFDPHNFLNPGVKTSSIDQVKVLVRSKYSQTHKHEKSRS